MFKPLRDKILELAISGKLVPQLDSEPAVEQIGPAPEPDEVPFALPEKWKWVQLEQLAQYRPSVKAEDDLEVSFAPLEKLSDGYDNCFCFDLIERWSKVKKGFSRFCNGDVIFAKIHPSFQNRKSAVVTQAHNGIGCGSTEYCVFRCKEPLVNQYLLWFFKSEYFISFGKNTFKGTVGQQRVNLDVITAMYFPLPPIEEQRRIVAKLDDIMGNLERMDQAYTELSGPMVKHFKNLVLQQAISGQLVPQLDREPAVEQVGPAPADDEVPFALPEKWKWVQLGVLLPFGISQQVQPTQIPDNAWVLGLEDIESNGDLLLKRYNSPRVDSSKNSFKAGDVLYSKMRPYLNKVIIADEAGFCSTELLVLDVQKAISPLLAQYLLSFLRSSYFVEYATLYSHGQKPRLDLRAGRCAWFPLPPLEEQRRIVARIEELFGDVDKLLEWQQFA